MTTGRYPEIRLRRLRQTENLREMLGRPLPHPKRFVWPVFVIEGANSEIPIDAMPGQSRLGVEKLLKALEPIVASGVGGILLFGVVGDNVKSLDASYAWNPEGPVQQAIRAIAKEFPHLTIFTDVCVCAYTSHGHCGILTDSGEVHNDQSLELLSNMALSHAEAGAHVVAPSAMMDGQVAAIRSKLGSNHHENTLILSYSTKFASSMYGPFREAADSSPGKGDRKGYQAPFNDLNQALRESVLDEAEGADMLMVKPALFYLDLIQRIKSNTLLPVAAYNVSGEYSMLIASSEKGWGDLNAMVAESIAALDRAGTDIIISYWANQLSKFMG